MIREASAYARVMNQRSKNYYARRAEEERVAADKAMDERAAQSHRELADHYSKLASGGEPPVNNRPNEGGVARKEFRIVP